MAAESNLLSYKHVFGYNSSVRKGIWYGEGDQVAFPAGQTAVLTHVEKRQQTFFQGTEHHGGISAMALSPNQRYLAVAEKATAVAPAAVSIFDVLTTRKLTTCAVPAMDAREYVSLAFSSENQFLLTQGGSSPSNQHDYTLVYWAWDKGRAMGAARIKRQEVEASDMAQLMSPEAAEEMRKNAQNGTTAVSAFGNADPVRECSFHPADSSLALVLGKGICKLLRYRDGVFSTEKTMSQSKNEFFLSHAWLPDERVVVGTESGVLMILDASGEFDHILEDRLERCQDLYLCRFSKGFLAASKDAAVHFFYQQEGTFVLKGEARDNAAEKVDAVPITCRGLAISSNEESVVFSTSNGQIFRVTLSATNLAQGLENSSLEPESLLAGFHVGAVNGMDVCVRKPIIVTCGADKTVRIWNYLDRTCEQCKTFAEEPHSVAVHPNGFLVVIGFSDKLRVMNLIMEDLKPWKDLPVKSCREVRFSNGGQYFAATNGNLIQVYKTYNCELILSLRGHNNKARSVAWTADDSALVSCGMDGGVYEYNLLVEGGHRTSDWVQKSVAFTSATVSTDPASMGNTIYICGSDKQLREVYNCGMQQCFETGLCLGQLQLCNSERALFAGIADPEEMTEGPIRCYRFPLEAQDYTDYPCHSAPVTRIRVSLDDTHVFSVGEDGCVFVFDLVARGSNALTNLPLAGCALAKEAPKRRDPKDPGGMNMLPYADEILVTRTFLDEKQGQLVELERQVDELSNQIEFQLRHRDLYHKEKIAEFEDKYGQEIEQERAKYELLREEKNDMEMECEENIRGIEERHAKQIQELEASFQNKMMLEVSRFQKLSAARDKEHAEWEGEYKGILGKHSGEIEDNQRRFALQKDDDEAQRSRILAEKDLSHRIHKETLSQLEQDADREIEELKDQYEDRLSAERDDKVRLRGQAGIHRKHHEDLKRQMAKKEEEFRFFSEEARKKDREIDKAIQEREQNMREIKDRDRTIGDKETKIYELKKQNAELEKFKFVLDYKIKELKAQIEPKNMDIQQMKRVIQGMDKDLEEYHRANKKLQSDINTLEKKQTTLQDEISLQRKRLADSATRAKKIKHELHQCSDLINKPKEFRDAFSKMINKYQKHSSANKKDAATKHDGGRKEGAKDLEKEKEDKEIADEYEKQREYLKKSVASLSKKVIEDSDIHKKDNQSAMLENIALIKTINELRREIQVAKMEAQTRKLGQ